MKRFLCLCVLLLVCTVRAYGLVIIDAGHGGADGGAVSPEGIVESPINLAITQKVEGLLTFLGQDTLMTRTTEDIDYPESCSTIRQKKVYDTKARTALINAQEAATVVSIHQNTLPSSPATHGAVVFYNRVEGAEIVAECVQNALNTAINDSEKEAKVIDKGIYIMNHITHPAVLVECGFLSNREDTARLQTEDYQKLLAAAVVSGLLQKEIPT